MAVGFPTKANWAAGDVLTAAALDDLAGTVNLVSAPLYNAAGKNKIINGDFGVWQRGTSFTPAASSNVYTADRFLTARDGTGTVTVSQQTFTPGAAPVTGYEGTFFYRYNQTVAGTGGTFTNVLVQNIEDVRTFAGQTATISFWAKTDSARTLNLNIPQVYGTGGSSTTFASSTTFSVTTSWTRFTYTVTIPSISGKTIGTSSYLQIAFQSAVNNATQTWDFWGVQLEAGTYATGFQTATGTVQGELSAAQRYYQRWTGQNDSGRLATLGGVPTTTILDSYIALPVSMRTNPTTIDYANIGVYMNANNTSYSGGTFTVLTAYPNGPVVRYTHTSGSFTQNWNGFIIQVGATAGYFGLSAEL